MTTLDRYVMRAVLGGVLVVMTVLMVLGALFVFIGQQDDIGVGNFTALNALWFTVLSLPQQVFELLPIATLIGTLIGVGSLARGSELTVMRSTGLSVWRIAGSVSLAGLLLVALGIAMGEYLAPPLQQMAKQQKAFAKFASVSFAGRGGAWVRDGNLIINVAQQSGVSEFDGMQLFELSPRHELLAMARAASATARADGGWDLSKFAESRFGEDGIAATLSERRKFDGTASAEFLGLTVAEPRQLETKVLRRLIDNLQRNGLDAQPQVFAYWSRIARTAAIFFAALLAVPFVFGSLRAAGAGARTVIGLLLGIGFFLAQQMLESGALVFDVNPAVLAWVPTAIMAFIGVTLIARTR